MLPKDKTYSWGKPAPHLINGNRVTCPRCEKGLAQVSETFGVLQCKLCDKESRNEPSRLGGRLDLVHPDMPPERVKKQRVEHFNSLVQPFRDSEPALEFIEAHPEKAKETFTPEQIRSAEYKWKDLPGFNTRHQSK